MTTTIAAPAPDPEGSEPSAQRILIGPVEAEELLARHPRNRNLQQAWVNKLAAIMKAGDWRDTGDPIQRDRAGNLLNGQHRLHAIIQSGCSLWFWVIDGLELDAQDVMDRGRRRTVGDVLVMHGHAQGVLLGASLKWVIAISEDKLANKNERALALQPTPKEMLDAVAKYPGIEGSLRLAKMAQNAAFRYPPSLAVALHYLMSCKAGTEAPDEFFERTFQSEGIHKGEPIWMLNDYLARDSQRRQRHAAVDLAIWTVKAWNAWRNDATVGTLKSYPDHPFPEISD